MVALTTTMCVATVGNHRLVRLSVALIALLKPTPLDAERLESRALAVAGVSSVCACLFCQVSQIRDIYCTLVQLHPAVLAGSCLHPPLPSLLSRPLWLWFGI